MEEVYKPISDFFYKEAGQWYAVTDQKGDRSRKSQIIFIDHQVIFEQTWFPGGEGIFIPGTPGTHPFGSTIGMSGKSQNIDPKKPILTFPDVFHVDFADSPGIVYRGWSSDKIYNNRAEIGNTPYPVVDRYDVSLGIYDVGFTIYELISVFLHEFDLFFQFLRFPQIVAVTEGDVTSPGFFDGFVAGDTSSRITCEPE